MEFKSDLSLYNHISTFTIEQDIIDTQREIDTHIKLVEVQRRYPIDNKTEIYMNEGHISNKQSFVRDLDSILKWRKDNDEFSKG